MQFFHFQNLHYRLADSFYWQAKKWKQENFQGWPSLFSVTLNTLNVLIIKDQVLTNRLNHTSRLNIMLQYKKKFIESISEFLAWLVYTLMRKIDLLESKNPLNVKHLFLLNRDSTLCHYLNLLKFLIDLYAHENVDANSAF